jgi:hypothetical protein
MSSIILMINVGHFPASCVSPWQKNYFYILRTSKVAVGVTSVRIAYRRLYPRG